MRRNGPAAQPDSRVPAPEQHKSRGRREEGQKPPPRAVRGLLTPLPALGRGRRGQFPGGKARRRGPGHNEQGQATAAAAVLQRRLRRRRVAVSASRPAGAVRRALSPPSPAATHPAPPRGPPLGGGGAGPARLRPLLRGGRQRGREGRESGRALPRPAPPIPSGGRRSRWGEEVRGRGCRFFSASAAPDTKREVREEAGSVGRGAVHRRAASQRPGRRHSPRPPGPGGGFGWRG